MRKILVSMAAALAVVMAMAVAVPVSAASDGSVTADLVEVGTGPDWNVVGSLCSQHHSKRESHSRCERGHGAES